MAARLFLHIGQGKTGTTTIQGFMARNGEALAGRGYLYPRLTGNGRHLELSLYAKGGNPATMPGWRRTGYDGPARLREAIERDLPAEISSSGCENVILSDEGLYRLRPGLRRIVDALAPVIGELVVIVYLRRQDDHVVSRYKHTMREGSALTLSEFIARPMTFDTWQYDALLRGLTEDFPQARLVVRVYDRARFRNGSLLQDFLDAVELPDLVYDKTYDELVRNTSLDAYTTEYLRRHNALHGRPKPALKRGLTLVSDGPDLRMEAAEHAALWEQFRPSNERLVTEFVPDAADVFLSPPKPRPGITQAEVTDEDLATVEARLQAVGPLRRRKAGRGR